MANLYRQLLGLIPESPLLVGTVAAVTGADVRITLADGALATARGQATVGQVVYFRPGGAIEGAAPSLTAVDIEV